MTHHCLQLLQKWKPPLVVVTVNVLGRLVSYDQDCLVFDGDTVCLPVKVGDPLYGDLVLRMYAEIASSFHSEYLKKQIILRGTFARMSADDIDALSARESLTLPENMTLFRMNDGVGELIDLSGDTITCDSFPLGQSASSGQWHSYKTGFAITSSCVGCGKCLSVCPQDCISERRTPFEILREHCTNCWECYRICPHGAICRVGVWLFQQRK